MALDAVLGAVNYSYGGDVDYIPILYGKQLLVEYLETAVVPAITNTDYQGQIKEQGSEVIISSLPDVTVEDHERGAEVGDYEELENPSVSLTIDYAKKYKFRVGTIDQAQARFVLAPKFLQKAEYAMEMAVDQHWFSQTRTTAAAANAGVTAGADSGLFDLGVTTDPLILSKTNVLDWVSSVATVLSEQSVPEDDDRWMAIPPWIQNLIDISELRQAHVSGDDRSSLYHGRPIGALHGIMLHRTMANYSATVGANVEWDILGGHRSAVTFATQVVDSDSLKTAQYFGKLYRGLQVYGFKTVKGEGLVHSVVTGAVLNA